MKTYLLIPIALILTVGSILTLVSCDPSGDTATKPVGPIPVDNIDALVYKPYGRILAQTYQQWIDEWFKTLPCNSCDGAGVNHNGSYTILDKSNRVYFLAGTTGEAGIRNIELLPEKAILFPIINIVKTFPCPENPDAAPARNQTVEDFLKAETALYLDGDIKLEVTLDSLPYRLTNYHRITTSVFKIFNDRTMSNCFNACTAPDKLQDALSDGYWVMLKGLEPGRHVLTIKGEIPKFGLISDVTYQIIVR